MEKQVESVVDDRNKEAGVAANEQRISRREEQLEVLPITQPTSEPGLTCSGLDTGLQIEDFIKDVTDSEPTKNVGEKPAESITTTVRVEKTVRTVRVTTETEKSLTENPRPESMPVSDNPTTTESPKSVQENTQATQEKAVQEDTQTVPVTTTEGENEETIDGAALSAANTDKPPVNMDKTPVNTNLEQVNANKQEQLNTDNPPVNIDKTPATSDQQSVTASKTPVNTAGTSAGTPANTVGTPANTAGTPTNTAGTPTNTAGTPANAAGTPANTAGTPANTAGTPANTAGTPANAAGTLSNIVKTPTPKKAPKSCVVNRASDAQQTQAHSTENPPQSKEKPPQSKEKPPQSNDSQPKSAANQPSPAEAQKPMKTGAKRGRKPGKRSEKGAKETTKSKSNSGEPKHLQVTFDLTTQPFSDPQQVQLRAQILVYGSIIQGSLPEEALMGAAFTDISKVRSLESFESHFNASRIVWEKTWKMAAERINKAVKTPTTSTNAANLPPAPPSKSKSTKRSSPKPSTPVIVQSSPSDFPAVSPLASTVMNMASVTISSWNSARARAPVPAPAPAPESWQFRAPRFPFTPPLSSTPAQQQPVLNVPWGANVTQFSSPVRTAWLGQTSYVPPITSPVPPVVVNQNLTDTSKGTKRRRSQQESSQVPATSAAPSGTSGVVGDVSPATAGLLEENNAREDVESMLPEELVNRLESAKRTAEEAASAAASVVEKSQTVWDEIKEKRKQNNISSKEAQLASSLAAVTAAASVAKAAAAAAHVAFAAALQARAMAKVITSENSTEDPTVTHVAQDPTVRVSSAINDAKHVMKEGIKNSSLVYSKATNLEAVVRAAELAAEAATQAGSVMSIGDPNSLSLPAIDKPKGKVGGKRRPRSKPAERKSDREGQIENPTESKKADADNNANDNNARKAQGGEEAEAEPSEGMVEDKQQGARNEEIVVGSHIEIVPDEEGLQNVWFSAKVKAIRGDGALVVYDELLNDQGDGKLEEWIDLTGQNGNVPRVRIAHPVTQEGAMRKRRRAATGTQVWVKDDHVDVWMRDGWWEGIVQSVDEDENLVTVYFPGDGDTEVTKSWNLRPTLVWDGNAWVLWNNIRHDVGIQSLEAPQEENEIPTPKRKKLIETPLSEGTKTRTNVKPTKRKKFSEVIEKDNKLQEKELEKSSKPYKVFKKNASKRTSPKKKNK